MVTDSLSVTEGSERSNRFAPLKSYSEKFHELFPYYLSIGMTYEQFWDGDPQIAKEYRKADDLIRHRKNEELWMQGLYIYQALCCVAPIFRDFAKKGTKPHPYPSAPHALTKADRAKEVQREEKQKYESGKRYMEGFMAKFNKRFEIHNERM